MPTELHRSTRGNREVLTLIGKDYTVTVEVTVSGLELDAATMEQLLHAPLRHMADRLRG